MINDSGIFDEDVINRGLVSSSEGELRMTELEKDTSEPKGIFSVCFWFSIFKTYI